MQQAGHAMKINELRGFGEAHIAEIRSDTHAHACRDGNLLGPLVGYELGCQPPDCQVGLPTGPPHTELLVICKLRQFANKVGMESKTKR